MTDETKPLSYVDFGLPPSVVSKVDVSRLVTEAERMDNLLTEAAVRAKTGAAEAASPAVSEQFAAFLQLNKLTFSDSKLRTQIVKQLQKLKDNVPIIHMTFAVEADPESLGQIALWLRQSVHPQAVIAVGLQPALVAGVYLRTPNHIHDLSLRGALAGSHDVLVKELEAFHGR